MESLTHETDDPCSEARLLFSQADSDVNVDDYVNVDSQVLTSQILSDEDIAASSLRLPAEEQSLPTEEEVDDEPPPVVISGKEAQEAVLTIRRFLLHLKDTDHYFLSLESADMIILNNIKQTKVTDYFNPASKK